MQAPCLRSWGILVAGQGGAERPGLSLRAGGGLMQSCQAVKEGRAGAEGAGRAGGPAGGGGGSAQAPPVGQQHRRGFPV